ncbi:hypothetical protein EK21DRAFT_60772 [Setomelanomma holmii]|uniref:Tautomerase cis-CaaD-like domain-containing protein n=1 Tax=Setomelanomma holmii TaxID=210430 RepID=A0A9P4LPR8_9PLEO|nr:hypothetical protein EK21DRAFT_60772 [Setomelanomma holmii]
MPHYLVYHSCDLSSSQYQAFATEITRLHCELFSAPSAFVNITFHPNPLPTPHAPPQPTPPPQSTTFVAARPVRTNYIHAHLRPRGPANAPKLRTLVETIMQIWSTHVQNGKGEGRLDDPKGLHNVFIFEDLAAGAEQGFVLPVAGEEGEWAERNMDEFRRRAQSGDESVARLMEEGGGRKG